MEEPKHGERPFKIPREEGGSPVPKNTSVLNEQRLKEHVRVFLRQCCVGVQHATRSELHEEPASLFRDEVLLQPKQGEQRDFERELNAGAEDGQIYFTRLNASLFKLFLC